MSLAGRMAGLSLACAVGLALGGCVRQPVGSLRMPQAPGTVQAGRQARYERPQAEVPAAQERAAPPSQPARNQILLWLVAGLTILGATTFLAERASRRGQREE